jgi:hypothetical protein
MGAPSAGSSGTGIPDENMVNGFAAALRKLLDSGFEPPLYWAMIGANGAIMGGGYQPGPDGTLIAEVTTRHIVGTGLATPVNVMFTDHEGRSANMVLHTEVSEIDN